MDGINQILTGQNITLLLFSTVVAILSGFVSSFLTYRFVTRKEMEERIKLEKGSEKKERIFQEVIHWVYPIKESANDLKNRLYGILETRDKDNGHLVGYKALSKNYDSGKYPNSSMSYDYFMNSTLFLFGQYFAWIQMLRNEISFELSESLKKNSELYIAIKNVSKKLFKYDPYNRCKGKDTQVFSMHQRAIGDLFIKSDEGNNHKCLTYPEFIQKLSDDQFKQYLEPLKVLMENLSPKNECRWRRLQDTMWALFDLVKECDKLLKQKNLRI